MQIIKALIGGIIGGGVGGYLTSYADSMIDNGSIWTILIAGLCAGIGVRLVCGSDRSFITGLVAAVATVVAVLGMQYATSVTELNVAKEKLESTAIPVVAERDLPSAEADPDEETEPADPTGTGDADAAPETVDEPAEEPETSDNESSKNDDAGNDAEVAEGDSETAADETVTTEPTGPQPEAGANASTPDMPGIVDPTEVQSDPEMSPLAYLAHGLSALLAFAIGAGSSSREDA